MTAPSGLTLHNQFTLGDDEFVANFVARHQVLETLLRRLRSVSVDGDGIHHILIGPRGMGKTSLLRRLAIAIKRDPDLSARYVPLSFREEQYNVLNLGDFWRNCGEALAEWAESSGRTELAHRLDIALAGEAWKTDQGSAEAFCAEMKALERRAILLVDNLDLILDALPSDAQWIFRRYLQERTGPILIGAATQALKVTADRAAAFYEFFQPHHLEPLDVHDSEKCMRALALGRGEHGRHVIAILDARPERLKTLHALTGGNPRVLALIYRLLETDESEAAMTDLETLLDQVTPYYKARIEEYQTAQQRAVIDAIALNWDPITTGELSRATKIASTTLSPLLIKFRKDGLLESVETSGAYAAHQIVERFLNIWYLMRHGTRRSRQKMRWLVEFLTCFFSSDELAEIARHADSQGSRKRWPAEYGSAFDDALIRGSSDIHDRATYRSVTATPSTAEMNRSAVVDAENTIEDQRVVEAQRLTRRAREYHDAGSLSKCVATLDELIARFADSEEYSLCGQVAQALLNKGFTLGQTGDNEGAVATYEAVVARFADAEEVSLREQVSRALFYKGVTLGRTGDNERAVATYEAVVARFADAEEVSFREQVAKSLVNKGVALGRTGDKMGEITAYEAVVARFADAEEVSLREQVAMALVNKGVTLGQTGDNEGALATYEAVVARFADAEEISLREQVARALVNKGITLGRTGDNEGEIATYEAVVGRFADAEEVSLREQVARALVNKGITLGQTGDNEGEIATYEAVVARFADAEEVSLREQVAKALVYKGITLGLTGDIEGAVATYEAVVARFADAEEVSLREQVARALVNKGVTLGQTGDIEGAVATYEAVMARFADAEEVSLREQVARALVNKGVAHGRTGDNKGALADFVAVVARFADAEEVRLREQVARALVNKGVALGRTGDNEGEIATYEAVVARFADAEEVSLREQVAKALVNKGITLGQTGDNEGEIATYETVVARFADAEEVSLREQVAKALVYKGITLGQTGEIEGAVATYEAVVARFADAEEVSLREQVAKALVNKGVALGQTGDKMGEITAYEAVVARFADAEEVSLREQVAMALVNKGVTLGQTGDNEGALATYEAVVARFADAEEVSLRKRVAKALVNKGITLGRTGDNEGEIATYEAVMARFADAGEISLREQVARAMAYKGTTLRRTGDNDGAIATYELVLQFLDGELSQELEVLIAQTQISLGNLLFDFRGETERAESLYERSHSYSPMMTGANLAWLYLLTERAKKASRIRDQLNELPASGRSLLDAGFDLVHENFGSAMDHFATALTTGIEIDGWSFADDLDRLLRLACQKGYGERLLAWFEETGFADRVAPIYVALKAYVRGARVLLDVSPEVRQTARMVFDRLDAPRRYQLKPALPKNMAKRTRGRPRKR